MNCCNHDCNQGRTCPNRKQYNVPTAAMYVVISILLATIILLTWK